MIILVPKEVDTISFDSIILNESLKQDIYDNTVFHLENIDDSNGIILHGPPGTGKSLICTAIVSECVRKNFTAITSAIRPVFPFLEEILRLFLDDAILIFEDIDSFGESRDTSTSDGLGEFLQFLNGISLRKSRLITIATTNYLERLDDALMKRPVRFNRNFKIDLPKPDEILQLFKLYFGEELEYIYKGVALPKIGITGAHIREMKRTAKLLMKKNNAELKDVLEEAIKTVSNAFSVNVTSKVGFN
jgi:SpoVK/Ycf46/Vps4 family AAA+-type ATPase